jgi:hypothetical protein
MVAVAGEIVPPGVCGPAADPYRAPRLPGPGGIVLTQRVGDPCIGLATEGLEPGAAIQWIGPRGAGDPSAPNRALNAYACIGNPALVLTGPARGQRGVVTAKQGACDHVCVDFPFKVLRRLRIGDRLQIYAQGLGLRLPDYPGLRVRHCSPRLIRGWGLASAPPRLLVPVTHRIPGAALESGGGEGADPPGLGDYRLRLDDPELAGRLGLGRLRFGDLVAIRHPQAGTGRGGGLTAIALVVSGASPLAGLGPRVLGLIAGSSRHLDPVLDRRANLAAVLGLRQLVGARSRPAPGLWT